MCNQRINKQTMKHLNQVQKLFHIIYKILIICYSLGKLANSLMPPGKSPKIISLWLGIICVCNVMMNVRTFFS